MEIDLYDLLKGDQVLIIFAVISLGYLLGKINIFGFHIGNVTGVLIAGLLFGSLGFTSSPEIATFGFTIFIFCVGLQAGPSFFAAFAANGGRYLILSIIVATSAILMCWLFSSLFLMDSGFAVGMLAGGLTSTPMLVGAQDAISGGLASLPEGMSVDDALKNISVAYSLTYLFGIAGVMLTIKYIPVLFRIDLAYEAQKIAPARASVKVLNENNLPMVRTYKVESSKMVGKSINQIQCATKQYFTVLGLRRNGNIIDHDVNTIIEPKDIISVIASVAQHSFAKKKGIEEVFDKELLNFRIRTKEIIVTSPDYVGKKISDLELSSVYGCYAIGLTRSGIDLPIDANTLLHKGDKMEVIGENDHITEVSEKLGRIETEIEKTDLLTMCIGVALGLLLGTMVLKFGDISIGLGSAGGLLIIGILIGFFRSVHPTFGDFPRAARNIMMDLGIVLFMSSIGLNAGSKVIESLMSVGPLLFICGIFIASVPVLVSFLIGRYIMKMNAAILLGAITGAMTSTPSLNIVTDAAKSQVPALGYAGSYTFSNVILTFVGAMLILL